MNERRHNDTAGSSMQPVASEAEVDSAATTLRPSVDFSDAGSIDKDGKAKATIELENVDGMRERKMTASADEDNPEQEDDTAEDQHLLVDESTPDPQAARTIDDPSTSPPPNTPPKPPSWSSLPHKSQLAILTLARLSEPLTQTSLQSYMFYQLKSFNPSHPPSDSTVAQQAGLLAAAFTGAQFLTAMLWGRAADTWGRKRVILIGLLGTAVGSVGFGFAGGFWQAVAWRVVGGALNGNIGVMRTMISEIVVEKKFQSRAFLLLPMTFNIGVIVGPVLGGLLADPVKRFPGLFGPGGMLGGEDGVGWLMRWPYALPNVVNAVFLGVGAIGVILGLEETLEGMRGGRDWGLVFSRWVWRSVLRRGRAKEYVALAAADDGLLAGDIEMSGGEAKKGQQHQRQASTASSTTKRRKLPLRRIWTPNLLLTLLAHGLLAMHLGCFSNLWFIFLSTPRYTPPSNPADPTNTNTTAPPSTLHLPPNYHPQPPFIFTGGLALSPPAIGTALAILGLIGITLQLLLYPRLTTTYGTTHTYRLALTLFPLSYTLTPFLALLPSHRFAMWVYMTLILLIQTLARTFALPATVILVNNACPHPSVLGTVHGIAQSVSSGARTVGPVISAWVYGKALNGGVVGAAWWGLAGVAVVGAVAGRWVREGSGWEVLLEGEERDEGEEGEGRM